MEKKKSFFPERSGKRRIYGKQFGGESWVCLFALGCDSSWGWAGRGGLVPRDPGGKSKLLLLRSHMGMWESPPGLAGDSQIPTEHPPLSPGQSLLSPGGAASLRNSPHPHHPLQIQGESHNPPQPFPNPSPPRVPGGALMPPPGSAGPRRRFEQELQGKLNKMAQPRRRRQRRVLPKQE